MLLLLEPVANVHRVYVGLRFLAHFGAPGVR